MKKKNIFKMIFEKIKSAFLQSSGTLLPHDADIPNEVYEIRDEVMSDLSMKQPHEDRINLKKDAERVRSDFNKNYINKTNGKEAT